MQNLVPSYPNRMKRRVFDLFLKGMYPSEVVALKKFDLKYTTIMVYYRHYKLAKKMRNAMLEQAFKRQLALKKANGGLDKKVITFLYRDFDALINRLPLPWFYKHRATLEDMMRYAVERWEAPEEVFEHEDIIKAFKERMVLPLPPN